MNTLVCDIAAVRFHIGDVIRKLRAEKEWTVKDLAEAAGVNKMSVSAIERGEANYRRDTIDKIAAALGTSVDKLFFTARNIDEQIVGVAGKDYDVEFTASFKLTREEEEHLMRWRRLKPSVRANIEVIMSDLVDGEEDVAAPAREKKKKTA